MTTSGRVIAGAVLVVAVAGVRPDAAHGAAIRRRANGAVGTVESAVRLSDREFWKLFSELSEPDGAFKSDNLLSNEVRFQTVIPDLVRQVKPGGIYVGVGPEQNFTYIAAMRPRLAFIVDVRRGNADLHLMYKALFELSADRGEFVSRLFSRRRPASVSAGSSAAELFAAYNDAASSEGLYLENIAAIRHQLTTVHRFALSGEDLQRIDAIYHVFFLLGPGIRYSPLGSFGGTVQPTYAELMAATDDRGQARGFLASEPTFASIREAEQRNAVVPVVGDFAGPKALRALAQYLKTHGDIVSMFYVSNVEEYLRQNQVWEQFCANAAALPVDGNSTLIRALRISIPEPPGAGFAPHLDKLAAEVSQCTP